MCEIPLEVADAEIIVRCVCSPYHCDGKKLKWKAFYPPLDSDGVSVIRADHVGADECKRRGKMLADLGQRKIYSGLAVIRAQSIRQCGATLVDSREEFPGHADIMHGHVMPNGEPPTPDIIERVRTRCKDLLALSAFFVDPEPHLEPWTGAALTPPPTPM